MSGSQCILLKHSMSDGHDCTLQCDADFGKMVLTLRVNLISPALLLNFLWQLPHQDERFAKTGIVGPAQITHRFDTRLVLPSGVAFKVYAYQPFSISESRPEPLQLEFLELLER